MISLNRNEQCWKSPCTYWKLLTDQPVAEVRIWQGWARGEGGGDTSLLQHSELL